MGPEGFTARCSMQTGGRRSCAALSLLTAHIAGLQGGNCRVKGKGKGEELQNGSLCLLCVLPGKEVANTNRGIEGTKAKATAGKEGVGGTDLSSPFSIVQWGHWAPRAANQGAVGCPC